LNRAAFVALSAFGVVVAISGALIAANIYEHMQAVAAVERGCATQLGRMKTIRADEQRFMRCLQSKGVIDKNATETFTVTRGTPEPLGLSFSTHFYVKPATVKTQSGVKARHT